MIFSVVVATRDRSEDVTRLLTSLCGMTLRGIDGLEIVIVDNGSVDATAAVVDAFERPENVTIRYLSERTPGKARAINLGIRSATGDVVAFVDDDIIVDERWATTIVEAFKTHSSMAGLGGRVELFNPQDQHVTLRTRKEPLLVARTEFLPFNPPILGCNMAFLTSAVRQIGLFDDNLGPGSVIGCADDLDFVYRALRAGLEIRYLPEVLVYHNHGRSTASQVREVQRRYVKGRGAFYYKFANDRQVRSWASREIRSRAIWTLKSLFRPAELTKSWQFVVDMVSGALVSRKVYSSNRVVPQSPAPPSV
jgi:GT2 family glycosyltransferase